MTTEIVHPIHTFPTIFTWLSSTVINIYDRKEIVLFSINTLLHVLKWKSGTTGVRCCSSSRCNLISVKLVSNEIPDAGNMVHNPSERCSDVEKL